MVAKSRRSKGRAKKAVLRIPGGTLFLFAGTVVILCIILLFINVLYGNDPARYGPESPGPGTATALPDVHPLPSPDRTAGESLFKTAEGTSDSTGGLQNGSGPAAADAGEPPIRIQPVERLPSFDIPPASGGARLSFVIDDAGYDLDALRLYLAVPLPLAIAVLPQLEKSREAAALVVSAGKELMLHQPMQAENEKLWPGPGAVEPGMTPEAIRTLVQANLEGLGIGVRGMNNHEGSLITADETLIGAVLDAALDYGVFFMDSRTTAKSKVSQAAGNAA